MSDDKKQDLSVSGPGSPISLNKCIQEGVIQPTPEIVCLIDGTGTGIAKDAPGIVYITPDDCSKQAIYYAKEQFDGKIPSYLWRYIRYMMFDEELMTNEQYLVHMKDVSDERRDQYLQTAKLIQYCESNPEMQQVIGLIQLIGGGLNMARKAKAGVRFYLEHPETHLHPKRQSRLVSLLEALKKEFGEDPKP